MSDALRLVQVSPENQDFLDLVKQLNAYLSVTDGDEHEFYDQFNEPDTLDYMVVGYLDEIPVACGALRKKSEEDVELKRMFTTPEARGKRIAAAVLHYLEQEARRLNYSRMVLETGRGQPGALRLYRRENYAEIENYPPYVGKLLSICFAKNL